tara:strand:+ start:446 stop:592 length:147 start_codon:yes stop_codon:yes gene_type:complete
MDLKQKYLLISISDSFKSRYDFLGNKKTTEQVSLGNTLPSHIEFISKN